MTVQEIRTKLFEMQDVAYKEFNDKLIPNGGASIGIRVPKVRALAKEILKGDCSQYLEQPYLEYSEERMLYGMVIGGIKPYSEKIFEYIDRWMASINNWAICDTAMSSLKIFQDKSWQDVGFDYLVDKLENSQQEYVMRACVVGMMSHYIDDKYIDRYVEILGDIKDQRYYVAMAIAWAVSVIAVKYYDKAITLLKSGKLDVWAHNKAIQKCIESYRLTDIQKSELRALKRR